MSGKRLHRYSASCSWEGSTGAGYERYGRDHRGEAAPAEAALALSSDAAFRGDARLLNPEQLVVLAASSCQLLSFLACAARAGIDVRRYVDDARGEMSEDDRPVRLSRIWLRPRIEVTAGPTEAVVRDLIRQAHDECYVASSLKTEISVEAQIVFLGLPPPP